MSTIIIRYCSSFMFIMAPYCNCTCGEWVSEWVSECCLTWILVAPGQIVKRPLQKERNCLLIYVCVCVCVCVRSRSMYNICIAFSVITVLHIIFVLFDVQIQFCLSCFDHDVTAATTNVITSLKCSPIERPTPLWIIVVY